MASKARAIAQATWSVVASRSMSPWTSLALTLVASLSLTPSMSLAQAVDHWEAVLQDGTLWHYWLPSNQPANDWFEGGFSDAAWPEGPAGFGYGDGDDNTVLPSTSAVYLRHTFEIDDLSHWLDAHFYMDYDDGFVAYLNGTEIGRGNAGQPGDFIAWNQVLDMDQEAVLYAGGTP